MFGGGLEIQVSGKGLDALFRAVDTRLRATDSKHKDAHARLAEEVRALAATRQSESDALRDDEGTLGTFRIDELSGWSAAGSTFYFIGEAAGKVECQTTDGDAIAAACAEARKLARPMETSDMPSSWRRRVLPVAVKHALREVRGDDVTDARQRYGPQALL